MSRYFCIIAISSLFLLGCGHNGFSGSGAVAGIENYLPTFPTFPARASNAPNISVCAQNGVTSGADVSDYDPGTLWTQYRNGGSRFAIIKATEGTTVLNALFQSDWSSANKAGVIRGAYHFFHPGEDPIAQAQFFLSTVGTMSPGDLPPVLDWEVSDGVSASVEIKNAQTWLQYVQAKTGRTPMIYVDPSFWNQLGNPQGFAQYPLYIANYSTSCPTVPPPWSTWAFWQTGFGHVTGLQSAQADMDVFNGPVTAL